MSIARQLLHEFRPFFRMLDEPLTRGSIGFGRSRSLFDEPFFALNREMLRGPAVDVSEAADGRYVVEAELPGIKKENLEVRLGDGGRSLTIQGKLFAATNGSENNATSPESEGIPFSDASGEGSTQIAAERSVIGKFSRTVVLPQPVDSDKVGAKLEDGILRITLHKALDKGSVAVSVE
ncbi:HSP20-like chaperone [Mycena belliarum]|uniref:HSP20-like chaperone n=1 Tax=Mycena belliarum TaxID=1033014 RepID=A0AAD6XXW8_9AGAR|nr:HSP20-like chaperone [Mycena belliae]